MVMVMVMVIMIFDRRSPPPFGNWNKPQQQAIPDCKAQQSPLCWNSVANPVHTPSVFPVVGTIQTQSDESQPLAVDSHNKQSLVLCDIKKESCLSLNQNRNIQRDGMVQA